MASETYAESVARLNARIEELEAEIDLLQRDLTTTYQAYDDMMRCKDEDIFELKAQLKDAGQKHFADADKMLPKGVEWPRFENGELVKPFDKLPDFDSGGVQKFIWTSSHNGAWQLQDAEGHMFNVMHGEPVKRPEPEALDAADTQESIDDDATIAPWEYCSKFGIGVEEGCDEATTVELMAKHLLERQRKLLGGE